MKFFNKYRLRRLALYAVLLVAMLLLLNAIYLNDDSVWGVTFEREKISLEVQKPETKAVKLSEITEENGYDLTQQFMLINTDHPLPDGFEAKVSEYKESGVFMNAEMCESYSELSKAVLDNANDNLYVSSHFRTQEEQAELYAEDPKTATKPLCSEHEAGLSLDVYVMYYAGEGFLKSEAGKFVNTSCHEYGFIIRYPHYGEKETGIKFEPWHIRYVGRPHSDIIYNNRLTLEEYVESLKIGKFYEVNGYLISRQKEVDGCLMIPVGYDKISVGSDNTGSFIITATRSVE